MALRISPNQHDIELLSLASKESAPEVARLCKARALHTGWSTAFISHRGMLFDTFVGEAAKHGMQLL